MATLMMTINEDRGTVFEIVDTTVREQGHECKIEVTYGHLSENGQHITIMGSKSDLLKLQTAFEQKGYPSSVFD